MMMPAGPSAGFIVIQADFPFAFFQRGFHRPAPSAHPDEFLGQTRTGRRAEIEFQFRFRSQRTLKHEPKPWAGQVIANRRHPQKSEVRDQRSFAAFFNPSAGPLHRGPVGDQVTHGDRARGCADDA